jgi:DNA-binding XRE family transcriptional regulator
MGHPLKELRKQLVMNQTEFAREIGVSKARVCQVEGGDGTFAAGLWAEIGDRFRGAIDMSGLTLEELMRGKRKRAKRSRSGREAA